MIYEILKIIKNAASSYLNSEEAVVLENIGKIEEATNVDDKIILTLLNTEEEATLKNKSLIKKVFSTDSETVTGFTKEAMPAYLNLYIMLAANRNNYEKGLQDVSSLIAFFQNKPVFTNINTPDHNSELSEFRFSIDLYSLPIEQLSYAWGVLGGKALPSAMYKVSVLKVQVDETPTTGSIIGEVRRKLDTNTSFIVSDNVKNDEALLDEDLSDE